jgi:anti-sigma B factor antagonist
VLDIGEIGDVSIVRITDEVDIVSAPRLEHVIKTIELTGSRRILLSLEDCSYCDSTCLNIVLRAVQRIGSRLAIVVPIGTKARRIFEVTGIANMAFVYPSLDEALAAVP